MSGEETRTHAFCRDRGARGGLTPRSLTARRNRDARPIVLAPGATFKLRAARGDAIRVLSGGAWITLEGDAHDWFLGRGEFLRVSRSGSVVIEALSSVALCTQRARSWLGALRGVWRIFGRARHVAPR